MTKDELAVIVLAAGLGTRMRSKDAKVLCKIMGKPMILRSVEVAVRITGNNNNTIVVIGYQAENVKKIVSQIFNVSFAYQKEQIGTGHAVLCSIPLLSNEVKDIIILCSDIPLLSTNTVRKLISYHRKNRNDISVLAADIPNPEGYGRISLAKDGNINKIIEEADASDKEKKNTLVNTGVFCVRRSCLEVTLKEIKRDNVKNEIYLTDIVEIGYNLGLRLGVCTSSSIFELVGVNTPEELARAEVLCDRYKTELA